MLQVHTENAAISDLHVGRKLVGRWLLELKPRAARNVGPSGPGAQWREPKLIDSAAKGTLTLVWALQS